MKSLVPVLFIFFLSLSGMGQQQVADFELDKSKSRNVYSLSNLSYENLYIILGNDIDFEFVRLDEDLVIKDFCVTPKTEKTFDDYLGGYLTEKELHMFYADKKFKSMGAAVFNHETKGFNTRMLDINPKKEKFIAANELGNELYILSAIKSTSILKIYHFFGDNESEISELDFAGIMYRDDPIYNKLYDAFNQGVENLRIIPEDVPVSLEIATSKVKVYFHDKIAILTFDDFARKTVVVRIDLADNSSTTQEFRQPWIGCSYDAFRKSNSFIADSALFQLNVCSQELALLVTSLKNSEDTLKTYRVKKDEEITFKNSPLIQEKTSTGIYGDRDRELDKTSQVLRKMTNSNAGLTVYPRKNYYELRIGGYVEIHNTGGGGMMMPMTTGGATISGPYGSFTTPTTTYYQPVTYGFNSYSNSKAVYFKTALDKQDFFHIPCEILTNSYDQIKKFIEQKEEDIEDLLVFKFDGKYILGYRYKANNKYYLWSFFD